MPSGCGSARVFTNDKSEPACGSVRFMVPVHSPLTIFSAKVAFSSSDPASKIASIAPCVSIGNKPKPMFAECSISSVNVTTERGMPMPPKSAGIGKPVPPISR